MTVISNTPKLQVYVDVKTRNTPTLLLGDPKIDNFASNKDGFVIGSSVFFTGTSGAGKTSFAIFLQKLFKNEKSALYSREMPACDVKEQTERFGVDHRNALIADKDDCANVKEFIQAIDVAKPKVVIIDSLQVLLKEDCTGGKPEQELWDLIATLREWTNRNDAVLFVIGHVTKGGVFEGSNTIKHMFDAHMHMNYDQVKEERTLTWTKNRKGSTAIKLYYTFTNDDIVFFTEDEWNTRSGDRDLDSIACSVLEGFLSGINEEHPGYKNFYNELVEKRTEIVDQFEGIELTAMFMIAIDNLLI